MRKIYIAILFLIFFTSCQGSSDANDSDFIYPQLPVNLYSYQFSMGEIVYKLPVNYTDFKNNNWIQPDEDNKFLSIKRIYHNQQERLGELRHTNFDAVVPIVYGSQFQGEQTVSDIYWDKSSLKTLHIQLPGGIIYTSTYEDILSAYSAPALIENWGDLYVLIYYNLDGPLDEYSKASVKIFWDKTNQEISGVYLKKTFPETSPDNSALLPLE